MQKAHRILAKPAAVVVLLCVLGVTAHAAAILVFTSRDAFRSYVGKPPDFSFNFNDLPNTDGAIYSAGNFGRLQVEGQFGVRDGALEFPASPEAIGALNFAGDVRAWGADINPLGGPGQVELTFGRQRARLNISGPSYLGFASAGSRLGGNAFNFRFTALDPGVIGIAATPSVNFLIDNIVVNSVPEPTTLMLLVAGAGLLGWSHRRRSRKDAQVPSAPEGEQPDVR